MAQAINEIDPDVMVLTEFRDSSRGLALVRELRRLGFNTLYTEGYPKSSGVLAAAKLHIHSQIEPGPSQFPHRWQHFSVGDDGLEFVGVYLNGSHSGTETLAQKQAFWDAISDAAQRLLNGHAIILGDLNTGRHLVDEEQSTFRCARSFGSLTQLGWEDAFRAVHGDRRAYSWWSTRRGFRLDHVFVTPALRHAIRSADYLTKTDSYVLAHDQPRPWPPELGAALSDHAALVVHLESNNAHL
jgi:exonuclease III